MTETPAMHAAMAQTLCMVFGNITWGQGGQGGGGSVVNIPLLILYEEKYPEITRWGLAAAVRRLPAPPPGPPHPRQLEARGDNVPAAAV